MLLLLLVARASAAPVPRPTKLAYVLVTPQSKERLVVATRSKVRRILPPLLISSLAWSPRQDEIALIRPIGNLKQIVELRTLDGRRRTLLSAVPASRFYGVAWSPDGKSLGLLEHDEHEAGFVEVVDVATLHRRTIARKIGTLEGIDWSRKGEIVVPTTRPHPLSRLALVDVATGRARRVPGPEGRSATFSPDGTRLAYSAQSGIVVLDLETHALRRVTDGGWQDDQPAWSPDGTRLVYSHAFGHCFTSDPGPPCNFELFVVPVGGGDPVNITKTAKLLERDPTWLR